jgi:hypothetical protein
MRHWAKPWNTVEFGIFPWRWVGVNSKRESCILTKGVGPLFRPSWGLCNGTGLGMSCYQKSAPIRRPQGLPNNSTVQRCVKKEAKKSSEPSLEKHGGRCAQWRTRLASLCRDALSARKELDGHKSPLA